MQSSKYQSRIRAVQRRNRNRKIMIMIFIGIVAVLAAVIFFIGSRSAKMKKEIKASVETLQELEAQSVDGIINQIRELKAKEEKAARDKILAERAAKVENFKQTLEVRDTTDLKKAFQDTVILGDSIAEAIVGYEFLGEDIVLYKRGENVGKADELFDKAIQLNPKCVFLEFGLNDMLIYSGDAQAFKNDYRAQVERLKEALPNAEVFVNSVLPVQQSAIDKHPEFGKYQEFNQALEEMCRELEVTFVDNTFLMEGHDELYAKDGMHPLKSYYPKWLTHMSLTAGI